MKNRLFLLIFLFCFVACKDQKKETSSGTTSYGTQPKLVVGIVVDQMRYDYLTRFWNRYGEGGFKRMIAEGYNCKNTHYNYVPTYTAPGHTSVYTGTTPAVHGIIANDWYDKEADESVYCAGDDSVTPVGTENDAGKMSPHRMKTTTVTDQLRLHTQMRGKVIGISLKDRGAILPAGHTANAAYWFHGEDEGVWISSSYYMDALPQWVSEFNDSDAAENYKKTWDTFYDIDTYTESGSDNNDFEGLFKGEKAPVFPHKLEELWEDNDGFDILKTSPYGNDLTTDFAIAAIDGENLGSDEDTDFLAVSYSATDYVGHQYGVNSKEIQDTYLRLDMDLERFFNVLDEKVGKGNYTVFLTADHAAVHVPLYLQSLKIPSGYAEVGNMAMAISKFVYARFKTDKLIKNMSNNQLFLDQEVLAALDVDPDDIEEAIARELLTYDDVSEVYTGTDMRTENYIHGAARLLQKGYNHKRSGDIVIALDPGYIPLIPEYPKEGSTHGSNYAYDTHVPLLFFGKGIRQGSTFKRVEIPDIAPTISSLLNIAFPNGTTGKPIREVME